MERSPWFRVGWPARLLTLAVVAGAVLLPSRSGGDPRTTAAPAARSTTPSVVAAVATTTTPTEDGVTSVPSTSVPATDAAIPAPVEAAPMPVAEAEPGTTLPAPAAGPVEIAAALTEVVDAGAPDPAESPDGPAIVAVVEDDAGNVSVERIELAPETDLAVVAEDLAAQGRLVAASFDAVVALDQPEVVTEADGGASSTNDAYRSQQWALDHVPFEAAWARTNGAGVIVAVIDTAVDLTHPDLVGQFVSPYHFLSTGSGPGMSTVPPGNFHGTHVAGTIAAIASNGIGIAGGSPGVRILPIEVLATDGGGRYSDITAAIIHAADQGAKVINLSLGGSAQSSSLDAAVAYAVNRGAVVMAASGNGYCTYGAPGCAINYPAASPAATGVGSITSAHACSAFTTRGAYVDLGAPGSSIIAPAPINLYGSGYVTASGTSMATPYASAAAAIVFAGQPSAAASQVVAALQSSALDVVDPGVDTCSGAGLVDPVAALDEFSINPPAPTTTAPTSLEAPRLAGVLAGRAMVRLSFVVPQGATAIYVRRDGVVIDTISATRRSYTDRSISPRTEYTYTVSAYSEQFGEGPISNARQVTSRG